MKTMSGPEPFKLHTGHPALELVNTLEFRFSKQTVDLIPTYKDLLRLTTQLQLLTAEQARRLGRSEREEEARRVVASTAELREALAKVLYGRIDGTRPPVRQLQVLERQFHAAAQHRRLLAGESHLEWNWAGVERQAEIPL